MMLNKKSFYINGQWVTPPKANDHIVINPSNEASCATISLGIQADVEQAVRAAKNAFLNWSKTPIEKRIELLKKLKQIYKSRAQDMAEAISLEMGAPIDMAKKMQVGAGVGHISSFISILEDFEFQQPLSEHSSDTIISKEPIGVCGLITPWNWPMNQITLKVIPALGAGCTTILKPSELAPLSAILFAEMIDEAEFPAGVFNLINGTGEGAGTALVKHKDVRMISFTGSTSAGITISKNAADSVKRVCLELGGKGANLIFNDASEKAIVSCIRHCFNNSGQSCNAPTRMLVQREIYQKALAIAVETANKTTVDLASQEGRHLGPVVSLNQFNKIQNLIQCGIDEGAKLLTGGLGKPENLEKGYFVRPTIFADVNNQMRIAREEIFGPVLVMIPFDNEQEAIDIANDTNYGLTNYIQTTDSQKSKRVAQELRSGMVEINGAPFDLGSPFGGYKLSGNGREGGKWGIEEYLEIKAISGINLSNK